MWGFRDHWIEFGLEYSKPTPVTEPTPLPMQERPVIHLLGHVAAAELDSERHVPRYLDFDPAAYRYW